MGDREPWWANDPELAALRRGVLAGLMGVDGRILGVSKQLLHRRFSRPAPTAAP